MTDDPTAIAALRDALAEALSGMHEMIGYMPDLLRDQQDMDRYINHAIASLMVTPGGLDAIRRAGYEPPTDKITTALMKAAVPWPGSDEYYVNLHDAKLIVQGVDVAPPAGGRPGQEPVVDMMQSDE